MIKKLNNIKGQALFEMIIFLPFLIFIFTIFYTVGNALSGTINQQKAVRGYYYQLVKGNSYLVPHSDLNDYKDAGIERIGFFAVGWTETDASTNKVTGNCFKFSSMLKSGSTEECESGTRDPAEQSSFVRAFTMYGVCGPIYSVVDNKLMINQEAQTAPCTLQ